MRWPGGAITVESYDLSPAGPAGLISVGAIGAGWQK